MGRIFLFLFGLNMVIVGGILSQSRQAPFQQFMLVQSGIRGNEQLIVLDPATNTQLAVTESYYEITLRYERNGWLYFWSRDNRNHETLYRRNIRHNIQQTIIEDGLSRALVNIILAEEKVVYVRNSGELAVVNLDATANHDIVLPDTVRVLEESYASFGYTPAQQTFYFAVRQGENIDIFHVRLDGRDLENLTQKLPSPHQCISYYGVDNLDIFNCDDLHYYRTPIESGLVELLPSVVSTDQRLMGIEGDTVKTIYLIDANSAQMYQVELDTETGTRQYAETELPSILASGDDWEIIRKQTATQFELWHVPTAGRETHIFSTDLMPAMYKWRDGNYLLITSDVVLTETDIYRIGSDGLEFQHLYHSDDLFHGINYFSMDDRDFYFAEAVAYNPRVYNLRRLSRDGTVQTYSQWQGTNRFYGWTDIFVREWSSKRWRIGAVAVIGLLLVSLFTKRWAIVR